MIILVMIINTLRIPRYQFSQIIKTNYPYMFGGIPAPAENPLQKRFLEHFFGRDILDGFKSAYLSILNGLAEQDTKLLQENLEPSLIKDIQFFDVEFLSYNEDIRVFCQKSFVCMGYHFPRRDEETGKPLQYDEQKGLGMFVNIKDFSETTIPILLGSRIYFQGLTKLHLKNQEIKERKQVHMFQFEIANNISLMDITQKGINLQNPEELTRIIIGSDYEWKVGDIDFILKGNRIDF